MKVIVYLDEPTDMRHAQNVLQAALDDAELGSCGFVFMDGKSGFYQRRKSGIVVIQIQKKRREAA